MVEVDDEAERKAEIKRTARYEAVRLLLNSPNVVNHEGKDLYGAAEALAMYLAHGSMPKTEEPA